MITTSIQREALAARASIEDAIDLQGGRWSRALSLWLDALVLLEEAE